MREAAEKLDFCTKIHPERGCKVEFGDRVRLYAAGGINERLKRLGGVNPNGDPWFRLVYGESRKSWLGGWEYDCLRDSGGTPLVDPIGRQLPLIIIQPTVVVPKYWPHLDRWYLEMWNPPERYGTPETWAADFTTMVPDHEGMAVKGPDLPGGTLIEQLGPYPERGDYEIAMGFQDVQGQPLPERSIIAAMEFAQMAKTMTDEFRYATRHRGIYEEHAKRKADEKAAAKDWLDREWDLLPKRHVGPGRSSQVGYKGVKQYGAYNPAHMTRALNN